MAYLTVFYLAKKFAEMQPKKETPAKKEKGGKEGGKQQQQPQQQEKKEKKKEEKKPAPAEEEMDECEAALAAEPKTKDPFAHLPKRYLMHHPAVSMATYWKCSESRVCLNKSDNCRLLAPLSWMSLRGSTPTRTP